MRFNTLFLAFISSILFSCEVNNNKENTSEIRYDTIRFGSYYGTEFSDIVRFQLRKEDGSRLTSLHDDSTYTVKLTLGKLTNLKPILVSQNQNVAIRQVGNNRFELKTNKVTDSDDDYDAQLAMLNTYDSSGYIIVRRDSTETEIGYKELEPFKNLDTTVRFKLKIKENKLINSSIFDIRPGLWKYASIKVEAIKKSLGDSTKSISNNDFKFFLEEYVSTINRLNDILYEHPDYEEFNSIIYADESLHKPKAIDFQRKVIEYGYRVASTEGAIFLERNTEFIKDHLGQYLTNDMTAFFELYAIEANQPYGEDGGIFLPLNQLVDRAIRWEKFHNSNSEFIFSEYASNELQAYKYFLMMGMDNTPAFGWTNQFQDEFKNALEYSINTYPESKLSKLFQDYLELLEETDFKETEKVTQFVKPYRPW